jgi:HAD superfamily hydrolase (TIGR01509 family)
LEKDAMKMIKGLFLDLDGTLADSMPVLQKVFGEFLEAHGILPDPAQFHGLAGVRLPDIMAFLKKRYGLPQEPEHLVDDYLAAVSGRYAEEAKPAPGARRLLAAAQERGVAVAVVTSSPQKVALDFLLAHGLSAYVSRLVSADQVRQGKPHPEPFLTALSQSGLAAEQGLAVEDSAAGVESALSAGLMTYLISLHEPPASIPGVAGCITRLDELVGLLG